MLLAPLGQRLLRPPTAAVAAGRRNNGLSITLAPAEILGVGPRMGSIEVGKDAYLLVASGDILDHRVQVTNVLIDGVPQSLETRHTRLYQQFKDRR